MSLGQSIYQRKICATITGKLVVILLFTFPFEISALAGHEIANSNTDARTTAFDTSETLLLHSSPDLETLTLLSTSTVITNGVLSLPLGEWRVIRSLSIDVEGIGSDSRLEVLVNGDVKASVFVPGYDPNYVVTIADAARSVELRHVSGGRIKVSRVVAMVQRKVGSPNPDLGSITSKAAASSVKIIRNTNEFMHHISQQNFERYLSPVKIRAGRVYAKATASGDTDSVLNQLMEELLHQMKANTSFIDQCMRDDDLFGSATQFLQLQYELDELLH